MCKRVFILKYAYLSLFAKKNTPASKMPQVSNLEKIKRVKEMQKLSMKIKKKILLKSLGKEKNILFENEKVSYSDEYLKVSVKKFDK